MNNNYSNTYPGTYAEASHGVQSLQSYVAKVMRQVYGKMFLGLIITAITSFGVAITPAVSEFILSSPFLFYGLMIVEVGLVLAISAAINKISTLVATSLFFLYALVNGFTLSVIFFAYEIGNIGLAFVTTSVTFGAMSLYGYVTRQDLSKLGSFLVMALIGVIIASVVNIFWGNGVLDLIISIAGVIIFIGLTAWDTQKIKRMASMTDPSMAGKVSTIGALELYLDFINLFLYILRLLSRANK
ncbi:MAG: Bax inhibitor-1/YccA family protein [Bacteroidales bacterium]|uniref:Bax inhibitor-1/YccA family protein n=1 Tax=Sodaliphilus sp. TaxID=2815818 RepID=UPI001B597730|nr:Bax inhibitor-1/YccA family protein [Candidatus Sodaliphilus limicaballi]